MEKEEIKKLLGDAYVEDMTVDEAVAILATQKTQAQQAKEEAARQVEQYKLSNDKISHENAEYKKANRAKLSEAQIRDAEYKNRIDALEAKAKARDKEVAIQTNKNRFLNLGMEDDLATETANAFVEKQDDVVFKNIAILKESIAKKTKADSLKSTEHPKTNNPNGDSNKGLTFEKFEKMSITDRRKLYETDKPTYDMMIKKEN